MENLRRPVNFKEHDSFIMSNADHLIDYEVANEIKDKELFSCYSGYEFCGYVWWQNNKWYCEIFRYHNYVETFSNEALEGIMIDVSFEYGSE